MKKKSKDFLKITFCGQGGIVPGAHNYTAVAAVSWLWVAEDRRCILTAQGAHSFPKTINDYKVRGSLCKVSLKINEASWAVSFWWQSFHSTPPTRIYLICHLDLRFQQVCKTFQSCPSWVTLYSSRKLFNLASRNFIVYFIRFSSLIIHKNHLKIC